MKTPISRFILLLMLVGGLLGSFALKNIAWRNLLFVKMSYMLRDVRAVDLWDIPLVLQDSKAETESFHRFCTGLAQSQRATYGLGLCGWIVGDFDLALKSLTVIKNERPKLASFWEGRIYDYRGDKAKAVSIWERAGLLSYVLDLASRWRLDGRFDRAIEVYQTLMAGHATLPGLELALAEAYIGAKEYDSAKVAIDVILSRDPGNLEAQLMMMYVLAFGQDRHEEALEIGESLLSNTGLSEEFLLDLYWRLGTIERHLGNTQAAVDYFVRYRDLPAAADWYGNFAIAQTYRLADDLEQGVAYIQQALAEAPNRPVCLRERGIIYLQLGQVEQAMGDFRRAIQLQPNNIGQRTSIASELRRSGHLALACEMLREAMVLAPNDARVKQEMQRCLE
jgi:tetratricopeptide (TPR) repeat protein